MSDARDKSDIVDLDCGLDFVKQLQPKKYFMNDRNKYKTVTRDEYGNETITEVTNDGSKKDTQYSYGLLAQDVMTLQQGQCACSQVAIAHEINTDKLGLKYEALIPVLIQAIKELSAKNDALESRILALESV